MADPAAPSLLPITGPTPEQLDAAGRAVAGWAPEAQLAFAIAAGASVGLALLAFLLIRFGGRKPQPDPPASAPMSPVQQTHPHVDATGESLAELTRAVHSLERTIQATGESTELDIRELRDEVRGLARKSSEDLRHVHSRIDGKADDVRLARLETRVDGLVGAAE